MENNSDLIQIDKQNDIDFDDNIIANTFCVECHEFPEYSIRFLSASSFSLVHCCLDGKYVEKYVNLKHKCEPFSLKCKYCEKKCNNICIKCKYTLCRECFKEHDKIPYLPNIQISSKNNKQESTIMSLINCQYFCNEHLLKYQFFCPVCKINLCEECNEGHLHINCPNLLEQNINLEHIIEPSNECFKRLYKLARLFYSCYIKNVTNSKMTLNILLNSILANNIVKFIQQNQAFEGIIIKNDYLNNIDKNSYLCKVFDSPEFNMYYSNLISNACDGNINDYYKLNKIRDEYKSQRLPRLFRKKSFYNSLKIQMFNIINTLDLTIAKFNVDKNTLNLNKEINYLKLKNKLYEFSMELFKVFSLKMNYKLDFELRRKVGNILGEVILKNFKVNLNDIEPTKYLLTLSNEKIVEKLTKLTNTKKNKPKDLEENKEIGTLKSKYIKSLQMLINKAKDEIDKFDIKNSKNSMNVISFKSLNENKEEIDKAIICNLFFFIKRKFGDEFNYQIHNKAHSINILLADEIKRLEKEKEKSLLDKDNDKYDYKKENNSTQKNNTKSEVNNNEIIINNNKICPIKYRSIQNLNEKIKVEEKMDSEFNYNSLEDNDPIINSTLNEFAKKLNMMKSTYSTSSYISLQQSLNLYLDGKKGQILEKNFSSINLAKIIKDCSEQKSNDNEIMNLCEKFRTTLNDGLSFLYSYLSNIAEKIEEISQLFNIDNLLNKYEITLPLNPKKEFDMIKSYDNKECPEEIYYLTLVFSYFYIISNIKILNRIKNDFEKIGLNEITINNIIKQNLIKKFMENINDFDESMPISNIWNQLKKNDNFVEDEKMNKLIINYVKKNDEEVYKNDLFNLLKSYCENIDLNGKDPQNIILEPFMEQNNLSDKIEKEE